MTSRRSFIKNSSIVLAGSALLPDKLPGRSKAEEKMALQLYSVDAEMKADPHRTLEAVADIGYKYIEHANYYNRKFYGYSAREFHKMVQGSGLKMLSGHTYLGTQHWNSSTKDFSDEWKYTIEDAAIAGQKFVISPWLDHTLWKDMNNLKKFMDAFNRSGELCKRSGLKFGYHNHDFEFTHNFDEITLYDVILQHTDPSLVAQQLDIGNMYGAGFSISDILTQYPGRFELMHVKDMQEKSNQANPLESTLLGGGLLPIQDIINQARQHGVASCFIIEQDSFQGKNPVACADANFKIINTLQKVCNEKNIYPMKQKVSH